MAATAGSKTLAAWRQGVAHGAFFQPIRLTVQSSTPVAAACAAPAVSRAPEPAESGEPSADTTGVEAKEATAVARGGESVVVIPAFTSVEVPGEQHNVALNVGGPVWAMDWLPEQSVVDTAASRAAGGKGKPKQKRAKNLQAKSKGKAAEAEQTGKENAVENDANSQVPEQETPDCSEGTNWRFLALSTHPPCDVRDGKVVRATPPDHYYDAQEAAPSLIQIWAVPVPSRAGKKRALPTPRFVYGIEHSSGVAWKMQWSTLVSDMPQEIKAREPLGVLAVTFGDGSLRVFAVPQIPPERLLGDKIAPDPTLIEILRPLVVAKSSRIISLCLQWSPRRWNLILSGCSDGSVELWNIESAIGNACATEESELEPLEPQRCFQDADTVGKQDAFDWGNGWAAVRAICWSPFDEFIFATTGNDSLFKIWDVREPRICLRSHRIRSTWGNSIQWLADTSILISGDQGSVYLYDIVSGSYQKLHFHPQVDSPIWDIQLARHEPIPLMISGCASGSIRIAPARKLYRNPHNSVEVCRISGRKDANVHDEYKELRVSFERSTIMGTAESSGPAIREFFERDAALHCLRLTTFKPRQFPCLLAAAGHAGLLVIMELQNMLDSFLATHFQPSAKKMGRPKAIPMGGHGSAQKKKALSNGQSKGRRGVTLGKFVDVKPNPSLPKAKAKKRKSVVATVEYVGVMSRAERVVDDQGEEVEEEEEEEAEFDHDAEESESDGSIDLEDDDNSDDERISISDDDEEEPRSAQPQLNAEEMRMMSEYQLDLSEEDAILLAIQMSEADRDHPIDLTRLRDDMDVSKPAIATTGKSKKASTSKSIKNLAASGETLSGDITSEQSVARSNPSVEPVIKPEPVLDTPVKAVTAAVSKRKLPSKKQAKKQRAVATSKSAAPAAVIAAIAEPMVDQATAFQMIAYQRGLNEEEALLEAIRLSEMESKQPPSRPKRSASDVDKLGQDAAITTTESSLKRRRKGIVPAKTALDAPPAVAVDETARIGQEREESASEEAVNNPHSHTTATTETEVEANGARVILATETESADDAKTLACPVAVAKEASSPPESVDAKQASTPPSETIDDAQSAQLTVADHPREKDLEADQPAAKSSRKKAAAKSKAKAPPVKRKKPTGRPPKAPGKAAGKAQSKRRRSGSDAMLQGAHGEFLSEEEALFMALQTSEIEF